MIWVEVKTLWQGKVGVRDRYVKEAVESVQGLTIIHGEHRMSIPFKKLKVLIVGQSEQRFKDRFGRSDPHRLIYFNWKPEAQQVRLVL